MPSRLPARSPATASETAATAARAGDPAAAARFVRATQADVWRLCTYLGDPGEAPDLAQETYLRAFRALPAFAARSGARTWLLAIARRTCADAVRDRRRRPRLDLAAEVPETAGAAADLGDGVALRQAVAALDPDRRGALLPPPPGGGGYPRAGAGGGGPGGAP